MKDEQERRMNEEEGHSLVIIKAGTATLTSLTGMTVRTSADDVV